MKAPRMPSGPGYFARARLKLACIVRFLGRTGSMIALAAFSFPAFAAPSCSFTTAGAVAFGAYNVFTTTANTNGVGSLKIKCTGGGGSSYVVSLSTGQSNNYTTRFMKLTTGNVDLDYNLYTNSARTTIWGNGSSSGTSTMSASGNGTTTLSVYGEIPAGQDASIGSYSDSITATVTF